MNFNISNGNELLPSNGITTVGEFFNTNSQLKKYVGSIEDNDGQGHVSRIAPNNIDHQFQNGHTYTLLPRLDGYRWIFTGDPERTADIIDRVNAMFPDGSVQRLTLTSMANNRNGHRATEFPLPSTAGAMARRSMTEVYCLREGRPTEQGNRYLDSSEVLDPDTEYTLEVDTTGTMAGFSAKDGPFAVASIGLFITAICNNFNHPERPAFVLAVIGAGLWVSVLVLASFLRCFAASTSCCTSYTLKHYRSSVVVISWFAGIVLAAVVIVLGAFSSGNK